MTLLQSFFIAAHGLRTNLGRSLLTVLGIVIGVAAIVLVLALGRGARQLVLREVESIGGDTLVVVPGGSPRRPSDVAETFLSRSLQHKDLGALRRPDNVSGAVLVEPAVLASGSLSYQDRVSRPLVLGTTPAVVRDIFRVAPSDGLLFTDADVTATARVVVLGSRVKEELFGESQALGEIIKVRGMALRVVGVLPPLGQVFVFNTDETVFVPVSTVQRDFLHIDYYHRIFVKAFDATFVERVAADIRATLREQHGIVDFSKDDFFVVTPADIAQGVRTVTQTLTIFLVAVASISLLVGGVGIMTMMLVAVTERTHEIGLRKAVGATYRDILWQFLFEALLLTLGGGILGIVLAGILSFVFAWFARWQLGVAWPRGLPFDAVVLGVGMAAGVGLVFGLYPARQAGGMDPVEALRSE